VATYCEIVVQEKDTDAEYIVSVDAHSQRKDERVQMMVFGRLGLRTQCDAGADAKVVIVLMTNERATWLARALLNAVDRKGGF